MIPLDLFVRDDVTYTHIFVTHMCIQSKSFNTSMAKARTRLKRETWTLRLFIIITMKFSLFLREKECGMKFIFVYFFTSGLWAILTRLFMSIIALLKWKEYLMSITQKFSDYCKVSPVYRGNAKWSVPFLYIVHVL